LARGRPTNPARVPVSSKGCRYYAPELNPVEQVWAYLRANRLGHRVLNSYDANVDACCDAWNRLMNTPERLASITHRTWARAVTG